MGAKEQMIEILRDRDTARIRFEYRSDGKNATINQDCFTRVADNLQSGHLSVVEGRHRVNMVTYSSWAYRDDAANTFYLGNNLRWSRDFNALIVHEAVHAYFDVTRTNMPWLHNETIAYIAQGYYLRNSGFPLARLEEDEPHELGYRAAREYASGSGNTEWIQSLQDKLRNDARYSSYIRNPYTGDG